MSILLFVHHGIFLAAGSWQALPRRAPWATPFSSDSERQGIGMLAVLLPLLASLNTAALPPTAPIETKHRGSVCSVVAPDFRGPQRCGRTDHAEFKAEPETYFLWRSDNDAMIWLGRAEREELLAFDSSATALISLRVRRVVSRDFT